MYNQASVGFVLILVVIALIINPLIKSFIAKFNKKDKNKNH
jgi:hypothetical protein